MEVALLSGGVMQYGPEEAQMSAPGCTFFVSVFVCVFVFCVCCTGGSNPDLSMLNDKDLSFFIFISSFKFYFETTS